MIDAYRWESTGTRSIDADEAADGGEGWVWIDLEGESQETIRRVVAPFGLDHTAVEEALAGNSLPLVEEHLDSVLVIVHGFATGKGTRLATPEIDVFVGERFLISIHDEELATLSHFKDRLVEETHLPVSSPAALLALMAGTSARRFTPLILELERQVDLLEELATRGDPQTIVEIHALRRDVIYLRRALAPQVEVYEDLSVSTHRVIDAEARRLFTKVTNQHLRSLEALEAGRALLGSVLETYRGAVADQTNEIMRVLTVFSAILLPLTLIAGIWGMNFDVIPGSTEEWGFWVLAGLMAILAGSVWIYFARRGFIGAPRLRELPKAVGLGLYTIGSAPIRVVAGGIRGRSKSDE